MNFILVFVGGGLGALFRFIIATWAQSLSRWYFPLGTLTVNVAGSLLIGLAMGYLTIRPGISPVWKLLLVTGFLGGFTTFSAFSWETLSLLQTSPGSAFLNIAAQVVLCILASFIGMVVIRQFAA